MPSSDEPTHGAAASGGGGRRADAALAFREALAREYLADFWRAAEATNEAYRQYLRDPGRREEVAAAFSRMTVAMKAADDADDHDAEVPMAGVWIDLVFAEYGKTPCRLAAAYIGAARHAADVPVDDGEALDLVARAVRQAS